MKITQTYSNRGAKVLRDKHCKMVGVEQFNKRRGIIGLWLNSLIYR